MAKWKRRSERVVAIESDIPAGWRIVRRVSLAFKADRPRHISIHAKARETKRVRTMAVEMMGPDPGYAASQLILVRLTRCGQGMCPLDDDNLTEALKAIRDGVADWIGRTDGNNTMRWQYSQRTDCSAYEVIIDVCHPVEKKKPAEPSAKRLVSEKIKQLKSAARRWKLVVGRWNEHKNSRWRLTEIARLVKRDGMSDPVSVWTISYREGVDEMCMCGVPEQECGDSMCVQCGGPLCPSCLTPVGVQKVHPACALLDERFALKAWADACLEVMPCAI